MILTSKEKKCQEKMTHVLNTESQDCSLRGLSGGWAAAGGGCGASMPLHVAPLSLAVFSGASPLGLSL